LKAAPADTDWSVDTDENEERPPKELIEDGFGVNICSDPTFPPLLGDEVKQVLGGVESECSLLSSSTVELKSNACYFRVFTILEGTRAIYSRAFIVAVLFEVKVREAMMFSKILSNSAFASTDSYTELVHVISESSKPTSAKTNQHFVRFYPIFVMSLGSQKKHEVVLVTACVAAWISRH